MRGPVSRGIQVTKAWVKRRRERGQEPNADEIWQRIKSNYPSLRESSQETIFQKCNPRR